MTIFNIHEAKTHFSNLLERVLGGEEIVIAKAGVPIARLIPFDEAASAARVPGVDKGKVISKPEFADPLAEFEL